MKPRGVKFLVVSLVAVFILASGVFVYLGAIKNNSRKVVQSTFDAEINDFMDSDGDGLMDKEEFDLGTNIYKKDTDGDGYEDGEEVKLGYDPLKIESGGNIDYDGDGLTGEDEEKYGTNPRLADSDFDGYDDGQEIASGNDPLDANLSDYVDLNAYNNAQASGAADIALEAGETSIEVTSQDRQQINYLEEAFSADNIYTFRDNITAYVETSGNMDKSKGDVALPEIGDNDIKILEDTSKEAKNAYIKSLETYFNKSITTYSSYNQYDINSGSGEADSLNDLSLIITALVQEIGDLAVPNDDELIGLHKKLFSALLQSQVVIESIKDDRITSTDKATMNIVNGYSELSYILYVMVFDEILPQIEIAVNK